MKKFVLWILMVFVLFTMSMANLTISVADTKNGDSYFFNSEGWPTKHWIYMTDGEIKSYESFGWKRETGVLWYDSERYVVEFDELKTSQIQNLYNQGHTFHVLYTWTCPANKLNKYTEQSVSVGYWQFSPAQARVYHESYEVPEIEVDSLSELPAVQFMSQWYYDGQACDTPDTELTENIDKYIRVRYVFDMFDFGFGSKLYLRNGDLVEQTFEEALKALNDGKYAENELHVWNGVRN